MARFDNKVVLVSGGARGQGAAEARLLVAQGAKVVIGDVLDNQGQALAVELGPAASFVRHDVTSEADWARAVEAAEKNPKAAAQSILDANPKGGKIDTLTQGFELTIPLYRTPETKGKRPFQVTDQNMTDSVNLMVEYGGLDAKAKDNPKAFYSNDYLPK